MTALIQGANCADLSREQYTEITQRLEAEFHRYGYSSDGGWWVKNPYNGNKEEFIFQSYTVQENTLRDLGVDEPYEIAIYYPHGTRGEMVLVLDRPTYNQWLEQIDAGHYPNL